MGKIALLYLTLCATIFITTLFVQIRRETKGKQGVTFNIPNLIILVVLIAIMSLVPIVNIKWLTSVIDEDV